MTCSFCGSSLDDNEVECPYCGHKVASSLSDEMEARFASRPEIDDDDELDEDDEPVGVSSASRKKVSIPKPKINVNRSSSSRSSSAPSRSSGSSVKANPAIISFALSALCLLLSLITLISVGSVKSQVKDMYQDMLSQFYQMQSNNSQLSSQVESLNTQVAGVGQTITTTQTSNLITITKQPESVETTIGRTDSALIFSVEAEGNVASISWQKYDETSGEWVNVVFDVDTSMNDRYGIKLYDDHYNGKTYLYAFGLTAEAAGSYRCVMYDSYNTPAISDTVKLDFKTVSVGA